MWREDQRLQRHLEPYSIDTRCSHANQDEFRRTLAPLARARCAGFPVAPPLDPPPAHDP